jgi:hypothetical protein
MFTRARTEAPKITVDRKREAAGRRLLKLPWLSRCNYGLAGFCETVISPTVLAISLRNGNPKT